MATMIRSIAPIDVLTAIATVVLLLFPEACWIDRVEVTELELAKFGVAELEVVLNLGNPDELDKCCIGGLMVEVKDGGGG